MTSLLVVLISNMGSDLTIVNAARVSHDKSHTEFHQPEDTRLLRFLLREGHHSPFYHPQITFRIKMPIFVARQWFRHHIGLARNEVSRRYVETEPEFWCPKGEWRAANQDNIKKGCDPIKIVEDECKFWANYHYSVAIEEASKRYKKLLELGVCREQARAVLPQAMMTEFIETGSLWAYINLIKERTSEGAQEEIKEYALLIKNELTKLYPITFQCI